MLAVEHYTNSIQNCRMLDFLCCMTGNFDTPGGMRGPTMGALTNAGNFGNMSNILPLPDAKQFDKIAGGEEFPVLKWWGWWADATSAYQQILSEDPYPITGGYDSSGDFMNMSNNLENWEALKKLDFFTVADLWHTPMSGGADLLLPAYHWIEIDCPRGSQGSTGAAGANVQCVEGPADTRHDLDIVIALGKELGKPYFTMENPWPTVKDMLDATVASAGFTSWKEYADYFEEHGWWDCKVSAPQIWGSYRRYQTGLLRLFYRDGGVGVSTPTSKIELWSTVIESFYPDWKEALPQFQYDPENPAANPKIHEKYPLVCVTGRRIPVYFHSEHRQLPWCRELWPSPRMEINPADAAELGLEQGDWAWIESKWGKVRQTVDLFYGVKRGVINCEHQWWFPELDTYDKGFQLCGINCINNKDAQDPLCGSSQLRAIPVKVYKATPENSPFGNPIPCGGDGTPIICDASDPRLKEWLPNYAPFEGKEA
ncbi:MAG: molybdopterin-dependent oxidoreductase [Coriobacteriales bacterium]|nr:molybdopterin-dependent oxidoreductase [Coriobacteriales bacterium]